MCVCMQTLAANMPWRDLRLALEVMFEGTEGAGTLPVVGTSKATVSGVHMHACMHAPIQRKRSANATRRIAARAVNTSSAARARLQLWLDLQIFATSF